MKKKVWKVWIFVSSQVVPSLLFLPFVFLFYLSWFLNFRRSFYFRFFCEYSLFFIRVFPCSFFICLLFSSEGGCHIGIAEIRQICWDDTRFISPLLFALLLCEFFFEWLFSPSLFVFLLRGLYQRCGAEALEVCLLCIQNLLIFMVITLILIFKCLLDENKTCCNLFWDMEFYG